MSELLDKIKTDLNWCRKNKDKRKDCEENVLKVIIGEAGRLDKAKLDDNAVISILKKVLSGIEESLKYKADDDNLTAEKKVVSSYLPKQLSKEEIKDIIKLNSHTTIAEIQKFFKQNYSGQYEGKLVSEVWKEMTASAS